MLYTVSRSLRLDYNALKQRLGSVYPDTGELSLCTSAFVTLDVSSRGIECIVKMEKAGARIRMHIKGEDRCISLGTPADVLGEGAMIQITPHMRIANSIATICVPVMKDGRFAGTVVIALKIDYLSGKVTDKAGTTGYGFMIGQTGLFIAHPDKANILELNVTTLTGMEEIATGMMSKKTGVESYRRWRSSPGMPTCSTRRSKAVRPPRMRSWPFWINPRTMCVPGRSPGRASPYGKRQGRRGPAP